MIHLTYENLKRNDDGGASDIPHSFPEEIHRLLRRKVIRGCSRLILFHQLTRVRACAFVSRRARPTRRRGRRQEREATPLQPPPRLVSSSSTPRASVSVRGRDAAAAAAAAPTPRPTDRQTVRPSPRLRVRRRASNVRLAVRFWLVVGEDPNNPLSAAEEIQNLSLISSSHF